MSPFNNHIFETWAGYSSENSIGREYTFRIQAPWCGERIRKRRLLIEKSYPQKFMITELENLFFISHNVGENLYLYPINALQILGKTK